MNPECFSTLLPRVPGLCVCERCVENAPKELKQKWFLNNPEYRKWFNKKSASATVRSIDAQRLARFKKLSKELMPIFESASKAVSVKEIHALLDCHVNDHFLRCTLKWMCDEELIAHIGSSFARGGGGRHYFATSRPELAKTASNNLISVILQIVEDSPVEISTEEILEIVAGMGCEQWANKDTVWRALRTIRREEFVNSRRVAVKCGQPQYVYSAKREAA